MMLRSPRAWALALGLGLTVSLAPRASAGASPADPDVPARLLEQLAQRAHGDRITRGWLSLGSGAALTTAGLLDEADGEVGFGRVVWIAGALSITGGVLSLLVPSPLEKLARDDGASSPGYSPHSLQRAWRARAEETRSARKVIGIVNFVIGGVGFATSGALGAGLEPWKDCGCGRWAVQLFTGGALFTSAGIAALLLRSEVEEGYDLAYPDSPRSALELQFAPLRGGATLQLRAAF